MIQQAHLQVWELKLTVRSPLFVGDGRRCQRTEYLYLPKQGQVLLLDEERFIRKLVEKGLIDAYERFVMGQKPNLYHFLTKTCGFSSNDLTEITSYAVGADDLEDNTRNGALREIHTFCRDGHHRAFVPGSSVKGALRTVLLTERILNDPEKGRGTLAEGRYFHTLNLKKDRLGKTADDPVNSILRGISVSDSLPIPNSAMMICGKHDVSAEGHENDISLFRECVEPGTEVTFRLTLDISILKNQITADTIRSSIQRWDDYYSKTYLPHFAPPLDSVDISLKNCLILGGGAGYFSKTVTYPYYGERGLEVTANQLAEMKSFRIHQHKRDIALGISPRTMKYTRYQGTLYPYGVCEVALT